MVAADDGEAAWLASVIVASKLRCSSGEDEGTKGHDGLQWSFLDGWFSMGIGMLARRWARVVARVSMIVDPNSPWNEHYIEGFLHRIIDDKDSNTFLIWIELYPVKIQKKSERG
jgi:hypothetical protein